ncbi:Ultraviolet-B receptor UVR8 [Durusdinium trenchii]|uniref:Ultraviolet-B receptor UVR8 n=1 Tax=Durusdinium trenchii TaxID=1381693 RepID=A0ABP0NIN9_9DINO
MAVADGAMAEAIRVSNLAGALLLQMEPPKTLEEVRLEVELASGIPSKLQSLVQGGEILDGGELTSGCELICVTDERPLYTWDWKGNPDAGHLQIEGSVLKAPSLQTDYVNVVTQEPLRSGVHYFEFVLHMVGDEQWCGVTRSRGAAGKHVSVRRREAEAWTYYCGRRRSREGTIRDGKGALHAHGKAIKEFEKACSEGDVINMLVDMDKRIVAFAKDSRVQGAFKVPGTEPLYVLTQVDTIVDHVELRKRPLEDCARGLLEALGGELMDLEEGDEVGSEAEFWPVPWPLPMPAAR